MTRENTSKKTSAPRQSNQPSRTRMIKFMVSEDELRELRMAAATRGHASAGACARELALESARQLLKTPVRKES